MNRSITLLTSLVLLTAGHPLWAQASKATDHQAPSRAAGARQRTAEAPAAERPASDRPTPIFDMSFQGGRVADYVDAIRKAAPGANIVVMPDAGRIDFPAVTLTGVSVRSAVQMLDNRTQELQDGILQLSVSETPGDAPDAAPIFAIDGRFVTRFQRTIPANETSRVWSLADLIQGGLKAEDALSAIEAVLSQYPEARGRPNIKFHRETGLLLARGSITQLDSISEVIDTLSGGAKGGRSRVDVGALDGRLKGLEQRVDALAKKLDGAARPN